MQLVPSPFSVGYSISVGLLETETSKGVKIEGVCSHFLAGLRGGIATAAVSVSNVKVPSPRE
jgi:hypothetical protein